MFVRRAYTRFLYIFSLALVIIAMTGIILLLEAKSFVFNESRQLAKDIEAFPVSVDSRSETIFENPEVESYFTNTLAGNTGNSWQAAVVSAFAHKSWFQNLASPVQRIAVIWPGERHEQIVKHFGDVLGWDETERKTFAQLIQSTDPILQEGKFYPKSYTLHKNASPGEVADVVHEMFSEEILRRYTPEVQQKVSLEDALVIASLLEREASDFANMREISGVIWNRLFIDMPLQLDATLQYARANNPYEPSWWPVPRPRDKFIDSPFNTYQNPGLPPGPIANPSSEAVLAALNPHITDCLFYFHANNGDYYCSKTYEGHVSKLRSVFGRGR